VSWFQRGYDGVADRPDEVAATLLDEIFEIQDELSEQTQEFIDSLADQYEKSGRLSARQKEVLREIMERHDIRDREMSEIDPHLERD
jgi:hypothetical protein